MGWSDWQPRWGAPMDVDFTNTLFGCYHIEATLTVPDASDVQTLLRGMRDDADAATGGAAASGPLGVQLARFAGGYDTTSGGSAVDYRLSASLGYQAHTLLGSAAANTLTQAPPPPLAGLAHEVIPVGQQGPYTVAGGLVDYESSLTTFTGWEPFTASWTVLVGWTNAAAGGFSPPASVPLRFWATAPTHTAPHVFPYLRPPLGYADGVVCADGDIDTTGLPDFGSYPCAGEVSVDLSLWSDPDLMLVMQTRWQQPGAAVPADPGASADGTLWAWTWNVRPEDPYYLTYPHAVYRMPRWRYWQPAPAAGTDAPYLRMTQRDDGKGISRHPRLNVSSGGPNQSASLSARRAPRLAAANNYGEPPITPSTSGS